MPSSEHASAGNTSGSIRFPQHLHRKYGAPNGTLYAAAMPAPAPHAANKRRCGGCRSPHSESFAAIAAPVCFKAPSRPSAYHATITIDIPRTPTWQSPVVFQAWNQIVCVALRHDRWRSESSAVQARE